MLLGKAADEYLQPTECSNIDAAELRDQVDVSTAPSTMRHQVPAMVAIIAATRMSTHARGVAFVGHVRRCTPRNDISLGHQIKQVRETRTTGFAHIHLDKFGQRIIRCIVVAPEWHEQLR